MPEVFLGRQELEILVALRKLSQGPLTACARQAIINGQT